MSTYFEYNGDFSRGSLLNRSSAIDRCWLISWGSDRRPESSFTMSWEGEAREEGMARSESI